MAGPYSLDPRTGLDNVDRPLRSRLLQVPKYRQKYLEYVRQIAERDLDWATFGKTVSEIKQSIHPFVAIDTRKMSSTADFESTTSDAEPNASKLGPSMSIRAFADGRRSYLLEHPAVKEAAPSRK
jgi:hypothetical protein